VFLVVVVLARPIPPPCDANVDIPLATGNILSGGRQYRAVIMPWMVFFQQAHGGEKAHRRDLPAARADTMLGPF